MSTKDSTSAVYDAKQLCYYPSMAELQTGATQQWGRDRAKEFMQDLVDVRHELNHVSAMEIAKCMGVVPEVVYRLELCQRDTRLSTLLRYCHVLGFRLVIEEVA